MSELGAFQQRFGALLERDSRIKDLSLRRALSIHRNTAALAARDALSANYPVVAAIIGRQAFEACASAFVERSPPRDPRLCLYGQGFADHVAEWAPFSELPYLSPVARLERLVIESLFAADATPLAPSCLAQGIDPGMPLRLHPATRIALFDCPVVDLWAAHQEDAATMLETIVWQPQIALVTRPALAIEMTAIDTATLAFLRAPTLGDAALAASECGGDVATVFATLLTAGALV